MKGEFYCIGDASATRGYDGRVVCTDKMLQLREDMKGQLSAQIRCFSCAGVRAELTATAELKHKSNIVRCLVHVH